MLIFRYKFLLIVLFQLFINCILANDINKKNNDTSIKNINYSCDDSLDKKVLRGGWYLWEPYQFNRLTAGGYNLVGMDIELVKNIAHLVNLLKDLNPIKEEFSIQKF